MQYRTFWPLLLASVAAMVLPGLSPKGKTLLGSRVTWAAGAAVSQPAKNLSADDAKQFIKRVDEELRTLMVEASTAEWVKNTYITEDTQRLAADANEALLGYMTEAIQAAARYSALRLDGDIERKLRLLRVSSPVAAPKSGKERLELTTLAAKLEAMYGKAKACPGPSRPKNKNKNKKGKGRRARQKCLDLEELTLLFARSRDYDELKAAWLGWRRPAQEMRPLYERYVALANQGARDIGFSDTGVMWRSAYDMTPAEFEREAERLWQQVKPFYEQLHCYVRSRLRRVYGNRVPAEGPIPAHLLGNMWAQEWTNIYPLVQPYRGQPSLDVSKEIRRKKYSPVEMVKLGERFFTSLGLDPLPQTFWQRSMFEKPRDRDVVCHASAWDVTMAGDLRIKMCIKPTEEDLVTIHHELGHNYYFHYYNHLPVVYQQGANDGFHEAIGDALALSVTPKYLKDLGLLRRLPRSERGIINVQMKDALEKVAFLPFGKLIDEWRWKVFSGRIPPEKYNEAWWQLRREYQGLAPPEPRSEKDFDPGAKYHIPANVPYTRYFLARILQFQFHKALCEAAGHQGPLHTCSVYGSHEAGERLKSMLALGASQPWPEALAVMTGTRQMDATALLEYFAPLRAWLDEANKGHTCGW